MECFLLAVVICILTYRIPGSPTASHPHVDSHLFKPMRKHIVPMILTFWGVADLAYQAFITVNSLNSVYTKLINNYC